jgi:hypothetical protein
VLEGPILLKTHHHYWYIAENTTLALRIENADITGFERLEILKICMEYLRF